MSAFTREEMRNIFSEYSQEQLLDIAVEADRLTELLSYEPFAVLLAGDTIQAAMDLSWMFAKGAQAAALRRMSEMNDSLDAGTEEETTEEE